MKKNNEELHSVIINLLENGNNKEATRIARILCNEFQDDLEAHLLLGMALLNDKKYDKSRRVVSKALERFPNESRFNKLLGHIFGNLNRLNDAEQNYIAAIEKAVDADKEEVAMLHYYLGEVLWGQNNRDDAVEQWKKALLIDPECIDAKKVLDDNLNMYSEPKAPNLVFDDLYHFQRIHMKRYYALVDRDEFISQDEAGAVTSIIMNGWNEFVSPRSKEIDNMTVEERTAFFKSITLNFTGIVVKWRNKK